MRRFNLLALLILPFAISGISQTTLEEYNYVTKGVKTQIDNGLDMKKGYELEPVSQHETSSSTVTLVKLVQVENPDVRRTAAYMLIYNKLNYPEEIICIPNPNSEQMILEAYWKALVNGSTSSEERLQHIIYLLGSNLAW